SMEQVRNELYGLLCMAGAAIVFFVFLGTASNFFPGPDWLWYVWALLGCSGWSFSSNRSLIVRGFDGAATSLPAALVSRGHRASLKLRDRLF
ncbi:MAG: hypothetical protein WA728_15860, partial [Xanthobacteraceae bacterium]